MSVTFIKKKHTCTSCGTNDYELFAIKRNTEVMIQYPVDCRPEELKPDGVYVEHLIRDDFGIIQTRIVIEKPCSKCNTFTLSADHVDNEEPVLNFYPQTEAHKWLDGLGKAGL